MAIKMIRTKGKKDTRRRYEPKPCVFAGMTKQEKRDYIASLDPLDPWVVSTKKRGAR
jgi:hypothetical protein